MPGINIVGPGNNRGADVNSEGRLRTVSTATDPEYHVNWEHGLAFYLQTVTTPVSGGVFLYIKNTFEYPLILENLYLVTDATSEDEIRIYRNPTGTPTGGNTTAPGNSNFGSSKVAEGTFLYGSDIGGLGLDELYNILPIYPETDNGYTFRNWIILTRNTSIAFMAVNGSAELEVSLPFFYLIGEL